MEKIAIGTMVHIKPYEKIKEINVVGGEGKKLAIDEIIAGFNLKLAEKQVKGFGGQWTGWKFWTRMKD